MAHYNSLKSLGENTLTLHDSVEFLGMHYLVQSTYLSNTTNGNNRHIFEQLDIGNPEALCELHYGYPANTGIWPEFKKFDFSAATRLVKALFIIIDARGLVKASEESEETTEVTINKSLEEESKLSVLLPSKHRSIKQVGIEKEITLNNL